jgi:uncharacterized protein YoxC
MGDESEIAELRRRLALLEKDVDGERNVSRYMLRKLNDVDDKLTSLAKSVDRVEESVALLRADLPKIIADVVGAVMREESTKRK